MVNMQREKAYHNSLAYWQLTTKKTNENYMKKKFARLTEQELHKIVNESLNRMLMERKAWVNPYQQYMQNYGDNGFGVFYNSDDDSQNWKVDVWRLNEMLKDMQKYCPSAASSIRRAISQIYKTVGTEGLQQSQQRQPQQQGWSQTYTRPNMSANYTQSQAQPNVNTNYTQNSTIPQYQQEQAQQQSKPVRNRRKRQPLRKKPQQPVQQQQWMQNPYANSQITSTLNY